MNRGWYVQGYVMLLACFALGGWALLFPFPLDAICPGVMLILIGMIGRTLSDEGWWR